MLHQSKYYWAYLTLKKYNPSSKLVRSSKDKIEGNEECIVIAAYTPDDDVNSDKGELFLGITRRS